MHKGPVSNQRVGSINSNTGSRGSKYNIHQSQGNHPHHISQSPGSVRNKI